MGEETTNYLASIYDVFNYTLFSLGNKEISLSTLLVMLVLLVGLIVISGKLKDILVDRLLSKTRLDTGAQQAIAAISRYLVMFIGFIVVLQTVGIDLTTLNVLAGAVGIGLGFGLQNVANNFVSGLIILTERPIKVGDRVEVDKITGRVTKIGARSTTVLTNSNLSIIVPNSKFISESVVNWSLANNMVRLSIPVAVSYKANVDEVITTLNSIAAENSDVLDSPAPSVSLTKLGDSMMSFTLDVWTKRVHSPGGLKSALNLDVVRRFAEKSISLEGPPISVEQVSFDVSDMNH
ncbi:MAG TPA: mechanosensitive ion channel [Pyrinomonadaceae bacterium]|nr:mechanosensitive ion channel [Pyrinomonadaceae bacterium]